MGRSIRIFGAIVHKFSHGISFSSANSFALQKGYPHSLLSLWAGVHSRLLQERALKTRRRQSAMGKLGRRLCLLLKKGVPVQYQIQLLLLCWRMLKSLIFPRKSWNATSKERLKRDKRLTSRSSMRSVAAVREVVKDCGGKMADPGSILFKFRRARVVNIKVADADKDQLLAIALDAGAEDVIEPPVYEDDPEDPSESYYKIVSYAENYSTILSKLREEGISFEPDNGFELLPLTTIEVDDEAMDLNKELISKLLELDDVDAVYSDQK